MNIRLLYFFFLLSIAQGMMAQLSSLGVVKDSVYIDKRCKISLSRENLYVATGQGLYKFEIWNADKGWEKMAMTDNAVYDFEVRGDTVIALSETSLFISTDKGETTKKITIDSIVPEWDKGHILKYLRGMAIHPFNTKKIHIAHNKGISYTEDGGNRWIVVDTLLWMEGLFYNPLNSQNLIGYYNQTSPDFANVYISKDGGFNWESVRGYVGATTTIFHNVTFHPTDENKIMICGTGIYAISEDQGHTWTKIGKEPSDPSMGVKPLVNLDYVLYDPRYTNILYGADFTAMHENKIRILRSMDGGFEWNTFYIIDEGFSNRVESMCINEGILVIYTMKGNIYILDVDAVEASISPAETKSNIAITPYYDLQGRPVAHPTSGIYIKDGRKVILR